MSARPIDPRAWLLWLAAVSIPAMVGRNPWPLAAAFLAALGVRAVAQQQDRVGWAGVLKLGATLALFGVLFNVLTAHVGDRVFARLPDRWPIIGGVLTINALAYGLVSALAILTLLLAGTTIGIVLDWNGLLRLLPDRFAMAAVATSVAWALIPQTTRALSDIREAQTARGYRPRGVRDAGPLLMPLLSGSLERSMTLAEALESRAFGAPLRDDPPAGRWTIAALSLGIGVGTLGAYSLALGNGLMTALSLPIAAALLWLAARSPHQDGPRRTRYRAPVWDRRAGVIAAASGACLLIEIAVLAAAPWALAWDPYPSMTMPAVHLPLMAAFGLLLVPAFVR
ncbi:MAG: energy-coupling factor transporter transmembrane component T [Thermomicrobiales bacterium]